MSDAEGDDDGAHRCVGCRDTAAESDLERFVFHDEVGLVYDMRGGAPGDAAYVHPLRGCLRAACWAGFARAFERPMDDLDAEEVVDEVRSGLRRRLREAVLEAARMDVLVADEDGSDAAGESGDLALVLSLHDGSPARIDRLEDDEPPVYEVARALLGDTVDVGRLDRLGVRGGDRGNTVGRTVEKLVCIEWDEG